MIITSRTYVELEEQTNYLILGFWSHSMSYKLSDAGIPVVKVQDGTSLGYSVYSLKIAESTIGASPASTGASEWNLVESADFIYMQNAYIERLQAALITAEAIEALMIRTKNLEVLNGAKIGSFQIDKGSLKSVYSKMGYIGNSYVQMWWEIDMSSTGLIVKASYGGTAEHPQIFEWTSEIGFDGFKVGQMEMKRDGIYKNGTKVL